MDLENFRPSPVPLSGAALIVALKIAQEREALKKRREARLAPLIRLAVLAQTALRAIL